MSKIVTISKFFYGTTVTVMNRSIDFSEGGPELQATLRVGAYTAQDYVAEFQRALRLAGSQLYICTLDRTTRQMTISAPLNFSLLSNSGSRLATSAYPMAGFSTAADFTGANSYTGTLGLGSEYVTQYPVGEYLDPDDNIVKEQGTVNVTPDGILSQISFGEVPRAEMNIRLITDLDLKNKPFVFKANGIMDAKSFLAYLLTKGRVEFMKDRDLPNVFFKCFLESTAEDRSALRVVLKNMDTPNIYETGRLTFRKVIV